MNNIPYIGEYNIHNIQNLNNNLDFHYIKNNTSIYKNKDESICIETIDKDGKKQWMKACADAGKEMFSSYEMAYGDCIVGGLGFSLLANSLIKKPEVKSVTVFEINQDIIDFNIQSELLNKNIKVVNKNIKEFESKEKFNCLLLDIHEHHSYDEIKKDIQFINNKIKCDLLWFWPAEVLLEDWSYKTNESIHRKIKELFYIESEKENLFSLLENTYFNWKKELDIPTLPNLKGEQIHRFIKNWQHYFITLN